MVSDSSITFHPGLRLRICGSAGEVLGVISVTRVDGHMVSGDVSLAPGEESTDSLVLQGLGQAADDLAFAVVDEDERRLRDRGLYFYDTERERVFRLGRDVVGIMITDGATRISFRALTPDV